MEEPQLHFEDYKIRPITLNDKEAYYSTFINSSEQTKYYTNSKTTYSNQVIYNYIDKIVTDNTRADFLILHNHKIIGEIVLNDINKMNAHYRIAIFNSDYFNKGIGTKASKLVFDYAFNYLNVKAIDLEVYSFNHRAINVYEKLGFVKVKDIYDDSEEKEYQKLLIMRLKK